MNRFVSELNSQEGTLDDILERLFQKTYNHTVLHPDLTKIYLNLSTEELLPLSERLAEHLEIGFQNFYTEILTRAKARGEIPQDTDIPMTAFFIDNQVIMLQFAYSTGYYKQRMKNYLGGRSLPDKDVVIRGLLEGVRRSIHGTDCPR